MTQINVVPRIAFEEASVVISAVVTVYFLGVATALGQDHFYPLLACFLIMALLLGRDLLVFNQDKVPWHHHPLLLVVGLFAVAIIVSTLMVDFAGVRRDQSELYRQSAMLLTAIMPFFLAYRVARRRCASRIIVWVAHAVMVICTLSIGLEAVGFTSYESYGMRRFGFLSDPAALLITIPVVVYAATRRRLLVACSLAVLLITVSRGPIMYALAGILALGAFGQGRARIEVLTLVGIGALVAFFMSSAVSELAERFVRIDQDDGRFLTSAAGLRLFLESPVFGHGYAAIGYYYPVYDDSMANTFGRYRDGVHPTASSTWVQMLSDGGILLAIPFFLLITLIAIYCIPRLKVWLRSIQGRPIAGASTWLLVILFLNHSAAWFLAGGPLTPLVMCFLGIVAGTLANEEMRKRNCGLGALAVRAR